MSIKTVGVVGCGLMGSGIAEVCSLAGFDVVVVKATAGPLEHAVARIEGSLNRSVAKGKLAKEARDAARARMTFHSRTDALAPCDLVIESTAEALTSKMQLLSSIEEAVSRDVLIATNTSSLPLKQLASLLVWPDRFLGLHFFSPVPAMKLVELGRLEVTSPATVALATEFVEALGKTLIVIGDEPGYLVNRLLVPFLCQAIEMLEQGVARAEDIDTALRLGCGHPLGPLALADLIGLDVVLAMSQALGVELRDNKRFKPPALLRRLVTGGELGRKTKLGFYDYRAETPIGRFAGSSPADRLALVG